MKFAGSQNVAFARFFCDISLWFANFGHKQKILQYLAACNTLRHETLCALRETVREFCTLILHGNWHCKSDPGEFGPGGLNLLVSHIGEFCPRDHIPYRESGPYLVNLVRVSFPQLVKTIVHC